MTTPNDTPCTWLDHVTALPALNVAIVRRAHRFIGIEETGPNRSGVIDGWNTRAGAPLGSPWCASYATAVYEDCGARVPPHSRASCDALRAWAKCEGLWVENPVEGAMVLYGVRVAGGRWRLLPSGEPDAVHVEIVARLYPRLKDRLRVIGGNTSWAGWSREGVAVDYKPADESRVLGYILPQPNRASLKVAA